MIWKEKPENEMTLEEYEKLAYHSRANLAWLNISGGEPTDRKDLKEIIEIFVKNCPNLKIINFTTNGMNLPNLAIVADYLSGIDAPIIGVNVSIDGPQPINDKIRGTPGGFIQAIEALKLVRSYKKIRSAAGMTLFPTNYAFIPETVEAIAQHIPGFNLRDMHLNFGHSSSHYYGNTKNNNQDRIDIQKVLPYFKQSLNLLSPFELVERIYQRKLLEFTRTGVTPGKCAAISSNIYISEKGDIYPCTIWDKKIGSLRENDFDLEALLSHLLVKETRKQVVEKKCPNCWTPCEAFPSIITDAKKSFFSIV